jgi:branched-chain amino acid transport system substrate-binding protein
VGRRFGGGPHRALGEVIVGRRGAIALALMAAAAAGCGGKDKKPEQVELKGTVAFGVLAPTSGDVASRGSDLVDGAKLAARELNAGGGVLGHKVELQIVDDACSGPAAYEAAKAFVTESGGVAGVVGGVCTEAAEHEIPVIDSTGRPFLVTSATDDNLVSKELTSTYWMTGTNYQQALSATYWMNYARAKRLAVVQDETPQSKDLAHQSIGLVDEVPKLVSLQTLEPGGQDVETIAKAAIAAKPDFVLWTGGPQKGGELVKALRANGFKGAFTATSASDDPAFLAAGGSGAEGAYVTATATPLNTPAAAPWRERFKAAYKRDPGFEAQQGYDSIRTLAHAAQRARSTDGAKMIKSMTTLDQKFANALGVVRFSGDHRLLYDNRVILKVKNGAFGWERSLRTDTLG